MSPPGWSPQFKGTFLMSTEGDIIKEFQQTLCWLNLRPH
jgi:hypothetical protein